MTTSRPEHSVYIPPAKRFCSQSRSEDERAFRQGRRSSEHDEKGGSGRSKRHRGGCSRSKANQEPDYVRNPSKWAKYDLREDGSQVLKGMSQDQVNKYAAFQFLDEVQKRKVSSRLQRDDESNTDVLDNSTESAKVVFKKPSKNLSKASKRDSTRGNVGKVDVSSSLRAQESHGGGIKMAEYVVGSKSAAQLHRERRQKKAKLISLHFEEDDTETVGDVNSDQSERDVEVCENVNDKRSKEAKSTRERTITSTTAISLSHLEDEEEET